MSGPEQSGRKLYAIDKMRPADKHSRILKLREEDGKGFYQKYHQQFVSVSCPACGNQGEDVFVKYGFNHKQCPSCLTLFCSPRPTEELLFKYYSDWEAPLYWTNLLVETDVSRKSLQYEPRAQELVNLLRARIGMCAESAVDLGAGSGAFALALKKTDFFKKVLAVDFSPDCVKACVKQGLDAVQGSIEDLPSNSADLITMNDLIEHVFDPKKFLRVCHRVLKPKGFISIATPNGQGFDFKIFKDRTVNITPPEHINYFNPKSMEILLEYAGYRVISSETPGILDTQIVIREVINNSYPLKDRNEFLHFLLMENSDEIISNFQRFLIDNKLSSHMLIVANKQEV
jgi:2-polyprenyl-3-methyl-5-hydroxy-6-metoxy-1,4-benzoquinol methylase/ribosomal protein S27E